MVGIQGLEKQEAEESRRPVQDTAFRCHCYPRRAREWEFWLLAVSVSQSCMQSLQWKY